MIQRTVIVIDFIYPMWQRILFGLAFTFIGVAAVLTVTMIVVMVFKEWRVNRLTGR